MWEDDKGTNIDLITLSLDMYNDPITFHLDMYQPHSQKSFPGYQNKKTAPIIIPAPPSLNTPCPFSLVQIHRPLLSNKIHSRVLAGQLLRARYSSLLFLHHPNLTLPSSSPRSYTALPKAQHAKPLLDLAAPPTLRRHRPLALPASAAPALHPRQCRV